MVPVKILLKLFIADTDVVSPEFRAQRRLNETRIPAIKNYILDNRSSYFNEYDYKRLLLRYPSG